MKSESQKNLLPSISDLISASWQTTKKSIPRYLIWNILFTILVIAIGVALALGYGTSFVGLLAPETYSALPLIFFTVLSATVIPLVVLLILTYTTTTILIVADENKEQSIGSHFKRSFSFIAPLSISSLFSSFFVGSVFLFFIPGLIISFYLSFITYNIILDKQKAWTAVKHSISMWQHNGKEIFKHIISISLLSSFSYQISRIISELIPDMYFENILIVIVIIFISAIYQMLISLFSTVYVIKLYREVEATTPKDLQPKMTWMWVTSVLGWLIAIAIGFSVFNYVRSISNEQWMNWYQGTIAPELEKAIKPLSQTEIDLLSKDSFVLINEKRADLSHRPLVQDSTLCEYLDVRLTELTTDGEYVGARFDRYLNSEALSKQYFNAYTKIGELYYPQATTLDRPDDVVSFWSEHSGTQDVPMLEDNFRAGCIKGTPEAGIIFVLAD